MKVDSDLVVAMEIECAFAMSQVVKSFYCLWKVFNCKCKNRKSFFFLE